MHHGDRSRTTRRSFTFSLPWAEASIRTALRVGWEFGWSRRCSDLSLGLPSSLGPTRMEFIGSSLYLRTKGRTRHVSLDLIPCFIAIQADPALLFQVRGVVGHFVRSILDRTNCARRMLGSITASRTQGTTRSLFRLTVCRSLEVRV